MRYRSSILLLTLCLTIFSFEQCSENPGINNSQAIPAKDLLGVKTFDSRSTGSLVRTYSYFHPAVNSASDLLSIGKANGYEANILMRYTSYPDSLAGEGIIHSAYITLTPSQYFLGDKNSPLAFDVLQIQSDWRPLTLTTTQLDSIQLNTTVRGTFSGVVDTSDIKIPIDTALVREWLIINHDKNTTNYGILLKPRANNSSIHAFYSSKNTGHPIPKLTIVRENFGKIDTINTSVTNANDTYTITGPDVNLSYSFAIQGSLSYRGFLWFDVSGVPQNAVVNNVRIEVNLNRAESKFFYRAVDSVRMYQATDSVKKDIAYYGSVGYRISGDVYTFTGVPLLLAVQKWVIKPSENFGFLLIPYQESSDPDVYSLYGAKADSTKRPRIIVTYTPQVR